MEVGRYLGTIPVPYRVPYGAETVKTVNWRRSTAHVPVVMMLTWRALYCVGTYMYGNSRLLVPVTASCPLLLWSPSSAFSIFLRAARSRAQYAHSQLALHCVLKSQLFLRKYNFL